MQNKIHFLLVGLLTALPINVIAAEEAYPVAFADNLSEDDYLGDLPKVLTVSRLAQSAADAPSAVTVIDRATIRASGAVDIPELFRLVPGMYVGTNAGFVYSTDYAVSYHGANSGYAGTMQVMINGRSVYSPLYGGVKWSELPIAIADIERIEVTRGPNAASFGANSYHGAVNIITQSPGDGAANSVIATHGNGRNEAFYRHNGKLDAFAYRFTAGYRQDDGLDDRNDFKRTRFMNAQTDAQINPTNNLEFEFGLADGARGEGLIRNIDGEAVGDPFIFTPRTRQANNYFGLVRWRHQVSDSSDLTVQAYHSYDRSDDQVTSVPLTSIPPLAPFIPFIAIDKLRINNEVIQKRTDIEAQHTFALGPSIRAVWGGSVRQDSMYAPFYLDSKKTDYFDLQRLFGHVEWRAHNKLTLNLGAMVEHNDFTGTDISPRASMNVKLHPDHTIRLGISSALRTPTYTEEKFQNRLVFPTRLARPSALIFQINANKGNLDPAQIISREIGYLGKFGDLQLDARLFSDRLDDIIRGNERSDFTSPPNTRLLNPRAVGFSQNNGSAEMNGIEFQANWQLSRQTKLLFNHAYVHIRETAPKLKVEYVDSTPRNTVSALITHQFNHQWDGSLAYYQTSEAHLLGDGNNVDLIRRTDARLARKFNAGRYTGEISAVVENLFNDHYEEFADYNTLKRRGRINVKLDF
jgi:iron complex outermembrane recepter protein